MRHWFLLPSSFFVVPLLVFLRLGASLPTLTSTAAVSPLNMCSSLVSSLVFSHASSPSATSHLHLAPRQSHMHRSSPSALSPPHLPFALPPRTVSYLFYILYFSNYSAPRPHPALVLPWTQRGRYPYSRVMYLYSTGVKRENPTYREHATRVVHVEEE